jgi:hypothetical protein
VERCPEIGGSQDGLVLRPVSNRMHLFSSIPNPGSFPRNDFHGFHRFPMAYVQQRYNNGCEAETPLAFSGVGVEKGVAYG